MSQPSHGEGSAPGREMVVILITGLLLGAGYNVIGQRSDPRWGIDWIGEDRLENLPTLESSAGPDGLPSAYTDIDDPLAIPATAGLPEIPNVGRPIKIPLATLKQFFDADAVFIVDAREADEYEISRIAGAINLPYDQAITDPELLENLDTGGRPIVTYCGGGSCELSLSLAEELFYSGHEKVLVYVGGFPEWQAAGYPTEGS